MDMVEKVARAIFENHRVRSIGDIRWDMDPEHWRGYARAAIAAMSDELLAHFQSAADSPALTSVEKYRVAMCMDAIRHLMNTETQAPSSE